MKHKTRDEKMWAYLSKKLGNTLLAKQVFRRVMTEFKSKKTEIHIQYKVDTKPLKQATEAAKQLTAQLSKIRVKA